MSNKYANEKHQAQAEEFILELGKFVLAFEKVCDAMRYNIMFMLRSQGLANQGMEQVIIGDKASSELQTLFGSLSCELPRIDEDDKKCIRDLLKSIKETTEQRNILLHCSWNLGTEATADTELYAATVRYRTKQNSGSSAELHGFSASYVRKLADDLERSQVLLGRFQYCVMQSNFKISTEFAKPL